MDFLSAAGGRSSYGRVAFKEGDTGDDTPLALHTSSDSTSDGKAIASVEGHPLSHQEKLDMLCEADPEKTFQIIRVGIAEISSIY